MSDFAYHITGGRAVAAVPERALGGTADLVWVHLSTTDDRARAWLREHAGLGDYVADALTAVETRPRCEAFEDGAFGDGALVNLRGRSTDDLAVADPLASVRIWAARGHVFSVTRSQLIAVDTVRRETEAGRITDPGDLIAAFATAITTDLDPEVADLGDRLDACEEQLDAARVFDLRRTVTQVRVRAIGYRRFLNPQRAALEKLGTLPGDWLAADDRLLLSAAADRAARMAEELDAIRERATLTHEALTDLRAEQIDQRSLVISVVAMIFLPLTFLTGLYGMNVEGLPGAQSPYAFDVIAVGCVLIALLIAAFFLRRHWFRE